MAEETPIRTVIFKHLPWFISVTTIICVAGVGMYFGVSDLLERFSPEKRIEWTQKRGQAACDDRVFKLIEQQRWCWFISGKGREALCIQDLNK